MILFFDISLPVTDTLFQGTSEDNMISEESHILILHLSVFVLCLKIFYKKKYNAQSKETAFLVWNLSYIRKSTFTIPIKSCYPVLQLVLNRRAMLRIVDTTLRNIFYEHWWPPGNQANTTERKPSASWTRERLDKKDSKNYHMTQPSTSLSPILNRV